MMLKVSNKIILKINTELNRGVILDVEGIYYIEYFFAWCGNSVFSVYQVKTLRRLKAHEIR